MASGEGLNDADSAPVQIEGEEIVEFWCFKVTMQFWRMQSVEELKFLQFWLFESSYILNTSVLLVTAKQAVYWVTRLSM